MNWLMICGFPFMIILWLINPTDSSKFYIFFILTFSSSYFISARVIVSQVIQIIYILISFSVENDVILFLIVLLMSLYTVFKVHWLNRYIYIEMTKFISFLYLDILNHGYHDYTSGRIYVIVTPIYIHITIETVAAISPIFDILLTIFTPIDPENYFVGSGTQQRWSNIFRL